MTSPSPPGLRAVGRETDRLGILVDDHPYDHGYWAAYNGEPRPADALARQGFDDCIAELMEERRRARSALGGSDG